MFIWHKGERERAKIQMENYCDLMQKACLLGAAKIMGKIFDT